LTPVIREVDQKNKRDTAERGRSYYTVDREEGETGRRATRLSAARDLALSQHDQRASAIENTPRLMRQSR